MRADALIIATMLSMIVGPPPRPVAADPDAPDGAIRLRSGVVRGPDHDAGVPASLRAVPGSLDLGGPALLKLRGPLDSRTRLRLESAGIRLSDPLGGDAYIARLPAGGPAAAAALAEIEWIAPYHPGLRLAPGLMAIEADDARTRVAITVHLFEDADAAVVARGLRHLGFQVDEATPGRPRTSTGAGSWGRVGFGAHPADWVRERGRIASWPEVVWIDTPPVYRFDNDSSAWVGQSGIGQGLATPLFDRGLFGAGQVVGILDSGVDVDACFFRDDSFGFPAVNQGVGVGSPDPGHRKVLIYDFLWNLDDPADPLDWDNLGHGTHTAGSIAGDRVDTPGERDHSDGMAPAAKLVVQDTGYLSSPPPGCGDIPAFGCPTQDLFPFYEQAFLQGARIHSNSYGDPAVVPINAYTAEGSRAADRAMWDHPELLMVFSAGNGGPASGSVNNPGTAKNAVTVGATNYGASADGLASFSSRGPTLDGRIKPDLTAPGVGIDSAGSDGHVGTGNCSTLVASGTSMSCPTVAGLAALVREYFTRGFYPTGAASPADAFSPSGALVKATLIASAAPMALVADPPPSMSQGWGRPVLDDALYFAGDRRRMSVQDVAARFTDPAQQDVYSIRVQDGDEPLRVVLAWTDYPSTPAAAVNLVNDLNLEVASPTGTVYRGNVFAGGFSVPGGVADARNNVEGVRVAGPEPGLWTVRVTAATIPEPAQGYALVATGRIPTTGVYLERTELAIDDTIGGNADGILDPGEWIELPLTLVHAGDTSASGVAVGLESLTPGIDVIRSSVSLPDLAPGEAAATGAPQLLFRVDTQHGCTDPLRLRLSYSADGFSRSEEVEFDTGSRSVFLRESFEGLTGWVFAASESTAAAGHWSIGDPEGTGFQPEWDVTPDPGSRCLFTAPNPGGGIGTDDVDSGVTVARSGSYDLSSHPEARLSLHRWFGNRDVGEDALDYFRLEIRQNASSPDVLLEHLGTDRNEPQWFERVFRVASFVPTGPAVQLKVSASDGFGPGSVIEAAVDELSFWDPVCEVHEPPPNPVDRLLAARVASDVVLTWQPPPVDPTHGEAASYVVYRSMMPSGGFAEIESLPGDTTTLLDAGAAGSADDLYWLVIAVNPAGPSDTPP